MMNPVTSSGASNILACVENQGEFGTGSPNSIQLSIMSEATGGLEGHIPGEKKFD